MNLLRYALISVAVLSLSSNSLATDYYVDDSCDGSGIGTLADPFCTIAQAASLAGPGDTVYIKGGAYNEPLIPQKSGVAEAYITFTNYGDETVTITGATMAPAIDISNRQYVIIDGLSIDYVRRWMYALNAHYNIIRNNHFSRAIDSGGSSKTGLFFQEATYNKIINNTIEDSTQDNLALHKSDKNLIEGNKIYKAKHTLWAIKCGNYNVIRNNYFYNEWQKIGEIYDCDGSGFDHQFDILNSTKYNLVENNTFAYVPSSGDSSPYSGIQYAGQNGIIRRNLFYDTVGPGLSLTLYSAEATYNLHNRVYNNVFYETDFAGVEISGSTAYHFADQVLKNNILMRSIFVRNDMRWSWYIELAGKPVQILTGRLTDFVFDTNNIFGNQVGDSYTITYGSRNSNSNPPQHPLSWWQENHPALFKDNIEINPQFVDSANHDFHLQENSPMRDTGIFLTKTVGSGSGNLMHVEDAGYFYDGFGIPEELGDLIQLDGQTQQARIMDIDYPNNIITPDRFLTWSDGQGVSLAYSGIKPDIGAFEYSAQQGCAQNADCEDQNPCTYDLCRYSACVNKDANLDNNGNIGLGDIIQAIGKWATADQAADIDSSGGVGLSDIIAIISLWANNC